jgi:membrane associated rhomboid family serine protease/Zn-finger nucleic acid-binding protein
MNKRRCPRCTFTLVPEPVRDASGTEAAEIDVCPRCRGAFVEQHEGAQLLGPFGHPASWARSGAARMTGASRLRCPSGHGPMQAWRVDVPDGSAVEVDTCATCEGLWLDAREGLRLARAGAALAPAAVRARGTVVRMNEPPPGFEKTGVGWYLFQLVTQLPIEVYNPKRRAAVVCHALIAACFVIFGLEVIAMAGGDEAFIMRYGAVASDLLQGRNLHAALTHMFLHGGIAHLLGNMYFLWTFGDNVEDRVGRGRFLFLYLFFGLAALALQVALTPEPSMPLVGASGAIGGLMGAYLGLFPRAQLYQVFLFIRWRLPVWFYLGAWLAMNAALGLAELNHLGSSRVAWWAHVGGFGAGLLWALTAGRRHKDGAEVRG